MSFTLNLPLVPGWEKRILDLKAIDDLTSLAADDDAPVTRELLLFLHSDVGAGKAIAVGQINELLNAMTAQERRDLLNVARLRAGRKSVDKIEREAAWVETQRMARLRPPIEFAREGSVYVDSAERARDGASAEAKARSLAAQNAERQSAAEAAIAQHEIDEAARLAADARITPKRFGGTQ